MPLDVLGRTRATLKESKKKKKKRRPGARLFWLVIRSVFLWGSPSSGLVSVIDPCVLDGYGSVIHVCCEVAAYGATTFGFGVYLHSACLVNGEFSGSLLAPGL
jgi:hypothetical protein